MFDRHEAKAGLALVMLIASMSAQGASCGPTPSAGPPPIDYRKAPPESLRTVEKFHFTPNVETLRKGESSTSIGRDLEFVLTYFPNHPRALNAMMRLAKREKSVRPGGAAEGVDCWFERAIDFQPDDGTVRLLHALWLVQRNDKSAAMQELEVARASAPPANANYFYNLGLAYLEAGDADRALEAAHRAYALGYPLPGLRDGLKKIGKWKPAPDEAGASPKTSTERVEGSPVSPETAPPPPK